jgi:hypothetical protein
VGIIVIATQVEELGKNRTMKEEAKVEISQSQYCPQPLFDVVIFLKRIFYVL